MRLVRRGQIPGTLVRRRLVMTAGQLDDLIANGIRKPTPTPETTSYLRNVRNPHD